MVKESSKALIRWINGGHGKGGYPPEQEQLNALNKELMRGFNYGDMNGDPLMRRKADLDQTYAAFERLPKEDQERFNEESERWMIEQAYFWWSKDPQSKKILEDIRVSRRNRIAHKELYGEEVRDEDVDKGAYDFLKEDKDYKGLGNIDAEAIRLRNEHAFEELPEEVKIFFRENAYILKLKKVSSVAHASSSRS